MTSFTPYDPLDPRYTHSAAGQTASFPSGNSTDPYGTAAWGGFETQPSLQPKKSHKKARGAGLVAVCAAVALLAGIGGGYLGSRIPTESDVSSVSSGSTVLYQSVSNKTGTGELSVADVAAQAADSVVEITTGSVSYAGQLVQTGAGSGVILSTDGYIVTNNHVVEGAASITVRTRNGDTYTAELVGVDEKTDLAVLKIDASGLTPAVFGDSDQLVVGETAVAIGNPLGELGGTVTSGIISALSRDMTIDGQTMTLLQTSAAINPGNSGGGLFNSAGELIGIVNAKSSGTGIEGLGFAIPGNTVKTVVKELIDNGYVTGRIDTGITVVDLTSQTDAFQYGVMRTGIYVLSVSGSDGFRAGDQILTMDGKEIASMSDYNDVVDAHQVGDTIAVTVRRGNRQVSLTMTMRQAGTGASSSASAV